MTSERRTVAVIQMQPRKGPPEHNIAALSAIFGQLSGDPPDVVVLPEAALTGYFLEGATLECARTATAFAELLAGAWRACSSATVEIICGFFELDDGTLFNSALAVRVAEGQAHILHLHRKVFLPTYGVFDEARFVSRGRSVANYEGSLGRTGLAICEDVWHSLVPMVLALKGMQILIVPSASPARGTTGPEIDSVAHWHRLVTAIAGEHGVFVLYAGLVGFEGGKGMSGGSCIVDPFGRVLGQAPSLVPAMLRAELDMREGAIARAALPLVGDLAEIAPELLRDPELIAMLYGRSGHLA